MDGWLALYHTDDDLIHGQYPIRGLSSAGADGMETGSPCRVLYIGPITEYPITLLYLPFRQGCKLLCAPLLPPPRPVLRLYLAASLRSIHLCNPTLLLSFFLLAGPSQDMCFDSLRHQ